MHAFLSCMRRCEFYWAHTLVLQVSFSSVILYVLSLRILQCLYDCLLQITCKQESLLLFSDQKTVNSWIDALTKAIQ